MNSDTRVGIVGAGYVANHHIRALKDLGFAKIVAICDQDEKRAREMAAKYGIERVCPDLPSMASLKPQVIHILTPPASHCALTLQALEMGCHVFVEKPMADTVEECDLMIESARAKGLVLSVNHSDRFDPVVLEAIQLVKDGACGEVMAVHSIRSSDYPPYAGGPLPAPFRQGSYPFRDLGVHSLYLLESFIGPVESLKVDYYGTGKDPLLTFDEWRANVECERGTGYIFLSWNARPIQSELWIHGTRGVIHVDRFLQTCELHGTLPGPKQIGIILNGWKSALQRSWRIPRNLMRFMTGSLKPSPGIYRSVQDFHKALQSGEPVPVSPEEGRRIMYRVCGTTDQADREKEYKLEEALNQPLPPARILVTGAAGFVGSRLLERLREQDEPIRLLLRKPPKADSPADPQMPGAPVSIFYGSLGQPDIVDRAVQGTDIVYHVGAAMKGGPAEFEQGTIWGTRNVIESCLRHHVKRLVYVSSMSVMDHAGHHTGDPVTENSPYEPFPLRRGAYTRTKLEAEQMVIQAAREQGLDAVVIRPGQIFGPGAEKVTPNGVIAIAGQWLVAGRGDRALPLVYRDDVVDALLLASSRNVPAGTLVNIVDTTRVTQNEYLSSAADALAKTRIIRVPIWIFMILASMIELLGTVMKRGVPLTRYRIKSLNPLWPFDVTVAEKVLGWKPRIGTKEGLNLTFQPSAAPMESPEKVAQ